MYVVNNIRLSSIPTTMPAEMKPRRRLVGASTKMYFTFEETSKYINAVSNLSTHFPSNVDVFLVPDFVSLVPAKQRLNGTQVMLGAQDTFWEDRGAYTGEVSPAVLAEIGCRIVEIGHAERRRLFAETDEQVGRKASAAVKNGIIPLVCIGEKAQAPEYAKGVQIAVAECRVQVEAVLKHITPTSEFVLAYEPVWAIGQPEPASARHIVAVTQGIRRVCKDLGADPRILYGGSAGRGLFKTIKDGVDGLFLGRFAHDPDNLSAIVSEVAIA